MYKWLSKHGRTILIVITALILLAFIMPLFTPFMVQAQSLQNDITRQRNIQDQLNRQIQQERERRDGFAATKAQLDQELTALETQITRINAEIAALSEQIDEKEAELDEAQRVLDNQLEAYARRLRSIQVHGSGGHLQALLEAESLSDLFYRQAMIEILMNHEREMINSMERARRTIEVNKLQIEDNRDRVSDARREVVLKRNEADAKAREQQRLIDESMRDIAAFERQLREAQLAEEALRRQMQTQLSNSGGVPVTGGPLQRPAAGPITSPFGNRVHPVTGRVTFHSGIDIGAPMGAPIVAAEAGVVTFAGWNGGYGNCIIIDHGGGRATLYGHASQLLVSRGQSVARGQLIARVGSTGVSTGPHLHFEVLHNGRPVNPLPFIQ